MLLGEQIQILVFKLDSFGTFNNIGEINHFDNLIWPDKFNGYAQFELWAPITPENVSLIKKGNILWCGGENAAVIEIVKSSVDDRGNKIYNVKGRTLESLLTTRIIWGTYNANSKYTSTIMYDLVNQNCINPIDTKRKIPFLEMAIDENIGTKQTYQKTGGEVYDALLNLARNDDIGFNVLFKPKEKKLIFKVVAGNDKTINQNILDPIEFSTDLEDILSSSYYSNNQDLKSVALVLGEGEGTQRKSQISGNNNSSLFERRELYVDARDLQSQMTDENGDIITIPPNEYTEMLIQRGSEKLVACEVTETFEAKVRVFGGIQYKFGVDYQKGDKVTIRDNELNVVVSVRITEVEEQFSNEYNLILTFGYAYPSLTQKVKQKVN